MISFSSISKKFKFWPRKDSQRKEKERGKLTKKVEKKPKNQNHPALIGMKWKKRTLFDEKHQVKNKTNTTKKSSWLYSDQKVNAQLFRKEDP